jgi:hypothetical protein
LTKDRKGHKENQVELGTKVSKEDKANLGTYWKVDYGIEPVQIHHRQ